MRRVHALRFFVSKKWNNLLKYKLFCLKFPTKSAKIPVKEKKKTRVRLFFYEKYPLKRRLGDGKRLFCRLETLIFLQNTYFFYNRVDIIETL